ncbi:MAG: hypothetical protein HKN01_01545 [Acidimicrobiia bacterium]|nr:hypothetical protein [Acidimicrobiia bacterium]
MPLGPNLDTWLRAEISYNAPLTASTWVDITSDIHGARMVTGRQGGDGGNFRPREIQFKLRNNSGQWDRDNSSSPHYNNLRKGMAMRLTFSDDLFATPHRLGRVYCTNIAIGHFNTHSGAVMTGQDLLSTSLGRFNVEELERPAELTGTRVAAVLDHVGTPSALRDRIDSGTVMCPATTLNGNALSICQEMQRTEHGAFFCNNRGELVFLDRHTIYTDTDYSTVNFDLTEDHVSAADVVPSNFLDSQDVTEGSSSGVTGKVLTRGTTTANEIRIVRSINGTQAMYDGDVEAQAWAAGDGAISTVQALKEVTIKPISAPDLISDQLMLSHFEPLTSLGVNLPFVGHASNYDVDHRIETVTHEMTEQDWTMKLGLSPYDTNRQTRSDNWHEVGVANQTSGRPAE